jgi:TRIAP1/MDM35 family protein
MASSLLPECTPLKAAYDSCFNAWFEGYLEPAVAAYTSSNDRAVYAKKKADEYEEKCGKLWTSYQACVQVCHTLLGLTHAYKPSNAQKAVKERGLDDMLRDARQENPLQTAPTPNHS